MTDIERQELWVKLQGELADLNEARAAALVVKDAAADLRALKRICDVQAALSALRDARSIRTLLAKIEAIGEPQR